MDSPTFSAREVANAADITLNQLMMWVDRNAILPGHGDMFDVARGLKRRYSATRAVQAALMKRLMPNCTSTRRSGMLAAGFTDLGTRSIDPDSSGEERLPGQLYRHGRTVLIANDGQDIGRVLRLLPGTPYEAFFQVPGGPRCDLATMVDVGPVLHTVYARLGCQYPAASNIAVGED